MCARESVRRLTVSVSVNVCRLIIFVSILLSSRRHSFTLSFTHTRAHKHTISLAQSERITHPLSVFYSLSPTQSLSRSVWDHTSAGSDGLEISGEISARTHYCFIGRYNVLMELTSEIFPFFFPSRCVVRCGFHYGLQLLSQVCVCACKHVWTRRVRAFVGWRVSCSVGRFHHGMHLFSQLCVCVWVWVGLWVVLWVGVYVCVFVCFSMSFMVS